MDGLPGTPLRFLPKSQAVCTDSWFSRSMRPSLCLWVGGMLALPMALISAWVGNLPSGHQITDPVLLAVSVGTVLRGFLYFNWQFLLMTLVYPIFMGAASTGILIYLARSRGRRVISDNANQAAKAAVFLATLPIWVQEVRSIQVLFWYGAATWFAMVIASLVARQLIKI